MASIEGIDPEFRRQFIGWDGEGYSVPDITLPEGPYGPRTTHVYNLLSNSRHESIERTEGLSTSDIFNFIYRYADSKQFVNVIFSGGYDVNMWLKDLPRETVGQLWQNNEVDWEGWHIFNIPRKVFKLRRAGEKEEFILWDVFGFFQTSFVKTIIEWKIATKEEAAQIESMKSLRSTFTPEELGSVQEYNFQECELLVKLMDKFRALAYQVGIPVRKYHGAGAISDILMRQNKVHLYKTATIEPDPKAKYCTDIYKLARYAYFGGRIEPIKLGHYEGTVWQDDINSAYPSAIATFPDLSTARWEHQYNRPKWDIEEGYGLYRIKWHMSKRASYYPLPYRLADGTILYPRNGEGWYWWPEAKALSETAEYGRDYTIREAWRIRPATLEYPFSGIIKTYRNRKILKDQGHMGEKVLKLGMNGWYGKFAQQVGWFIDDNGEVHPPRYHDLVVAGVITSDCRARLYRASHPVRDSVIAFATDAFLTTEHAEVAIGEFLGSWTEEEYEGITIAQPGVYWLYHAGEAKPAKRKTRGLSGLAAITDNDILAAWAEGKNVLSISETRFLGAGVALERKDWSMWGRWWTDDRELEIGPTGKRLPIKGACDYHKQLVGTLPFPQPMKGISTPHSIEWMDEALDPFPDEGELE